MDILNCDDYDLQLNQLCEDVERENNEDKQLYNVCENLSQHQYNISSQDGGGLKRQTTTSEIEECPPTKKKYGPSTSRYDETTPSQASDTNLADTLPTRLAALQLRAMQPSYTVRTLTAADKEPVLEFLRRFFFRDEPMNLAVNLLETPESRCIELEEYAAATLDDGVSFAAVDESGEFVGIVINGIVKRQELNSKDADKSEDCPNEKFSRILRVLGHLDMEARIWDKLPETCNAVVEVRIASTHSDWRGRGLMRVLCEETERAAIAAGAGALRMDTTSAFSAAAAERLKYKKIYSVFYEELPFAPHPDPPHVEARVYIKEL